MLQIVMVSSELVVLLIVCVGINTGSAQQGELTTELVSSLKAIHSYTQFYVVAQEQLQLVYKNFSPHRILSRWIIC